MSRFDSQCSIEDVNKEDECLPSSSEDSQDGVSSPMETDDEPEFSQKYYDIEPCYYSLTGKSDRNCRGIVYRFRKDSDLKGFQSHDGTLYRLRDSVFVEVSQNEPYVIAAICGFKYTKRDHVVVKLTRYFRADDIPELSLNLMKQERAELEINPHLCPQSLNRELFNSEMQMTHGVSCLRGKCIVEYVKDVRQARTVADFALDNDTFFYCLHYNQDSTKLASTHYAIRVGTAFQATLPPLAKCSVGDDKDRDELLYRPNSIEPVEEEDYIKLARCYRSYTLSGNHMLDSQKNAREQLVSYYYLWKKTPEATKPKQAARRINPTSIKRPAKEKVKASRPTSTEYLDFDSASESDVENNGPSGRACHHCYGAESKDWHHANGLLLCTDCRLYYKKYGQLRHVANRPTQVPACLFKRSNSDEEESGVRTRAGKKEQRKRTPSSMSETPDRRSPSGASNGAPQLIAEETPTKRQNGSSKRGVAKRPLLNGALNNGEKSNSLEPSSPTTPPPNITNGLTNGHSAGPSTPNGETAIKRMKMEYQQDYDSDDEPKMTIDEGDDEPMPVLNGIKKEEPVEEMKLDLNGTSNEDTVLENGPTTSKDSSGSPNGTDVAVIEASVEVEPEPSTGGNGTDEDRDIEPPVSPDCSADTFEAGTEVELQTKNAEFVRSIIRSCGPRCSRTDMHYKLKIGSDYEQRLKDKEARKIQQAQNQKLHQEQETPKSVAPQVQVKKDQQAQHQAQQALLHQQQQQQLAQQNAVHHQMQMQLHNAALIGLPPEVLRQMMPHQFIDPAAAMMMQQLIGQHQQQQGAAAAIQHFAMQQQMEHAQLMRMQQEIAQQHQQQQKLIEQRNAQQAREREQQQQQQQQQRERERQAVAAQQQALQQQQNAANMIGPHNAQLMQMIALAAASGQHIPPEMARLMELATQHSVNQAQAQQQAQQAQREQQERERREREAREREAREQREREQREREQREREQAAREQAAREAQAQAAAAAIQQNMALDPNHPHVQQMLMQQFILNPGHFLQYLQQQQGAQQQAQQQQPQQGQNPIQMMQHAIPPGAAGEMMRRLQSEPTMRPQHQ
ncbi:hypothetical protein CAEBREN_02362 [Caenorhabditis brenneri]|uniref:Uncharacterized protein n=1 Tax=Caenorhabditis brenneri TaxID=135651 RepID=G0NQX4_CAEBE|nr:hypothetical protein CAEBREN_02362 [Caenorhabditis brenneri]